MTYPSYVGIHRNNGFSFLGRAQLELPTTDVICSSTQFLDIHLKRNTKPKQMQYGYWLVNRLRDRYCILWRGGLMVGRDLISALRLQRTVIEATSFSSCL